MIADFFKTLAQLPSPPFQRVLWLSIAYSLATAVVLWFVIDGVLNHTRFFESVWLETPLDILGGLAAIVLLILLLPAFIGMIASFMLESICRAVEARYYPELPEARSQSIMEAIWIGLRFTVILVVLNLVVLPLMFIPPLYFVVGWVLNGYLLGREYFELVACRRLNPADTSALKRRQRFAIWLSGLIIAVIATIPFINLFLPLIGTAYMLHTFERVR